MAGDPCQDQAQQEPEPCEDQAEVVADGGEDGVDLVADIAFEVVAAEMAVGFM